jgi:uncharacterized membrane protein YcaP (DUF421 family)
MIPDLLGLEQKDLLLHQMLLRTVIVFVTAIIFIRIAGVRSFGTKTPFDIVVSITLGALLSRCITGHYPFFTTLLAAMFLASFHRLCAWITYKSEFMSSIMEGDSVCLYRDGKKNERKLRMHSISEKDIMQALHEEGLKDLEKVENIWLEPDGKISIVKKES